MEKKINIFLSCRVSKQVHLVPSLQIHSIFIHLSLLKSNCQNRNKVTREIEIDEYRVQV